MYGYEVKVRGTLYLWGSSGVASNLQWPLLLILRNDVVGDPIEIQSETADGHKSVIGTLQKGECYTLPLLGLRGVLATCDVDSNVTCVILVPNIGPLA
jgi:hypothetical protein